MLSDIQRPVSDTVFKSIWRSVSGVSVPRPAIDYILWIGSSTPAETSLLNSVLGRQENPLRAKMCAEGIDVPIISRAFGGQTTSTLLAALPGYLTDMGDVVSKGKKVAVLVNIGSNDITTTDYEDMPVEDRELMVNNLHAIVTQIEAAGMEAIVATSHSRQGAAARFEEWADKLFRPFIALRCPAWYSGNLAIFDYCRLYTTNDSIPNWFQADGVHPWVATGYYQEYSANRVKSNAVCKPLPATENYIFSWTFGAGNLVGGINQLGGAGSGSFSTGTVVKTTGVVNPVASLSWVNANTTTTSRGNSGVWDISLANHRIQSASLYKSGSAITFTANFGVSYNGKTGKLRATGNSSTANRLTQVTVGASSAVINASTGISIVELPFILDSNGQLIILAAPYAPSTFANVSGFEFVFD